MTKASKVHLPRLVEGERHLTLCGRPAGTLPVAADEDGASCAVCLRENARGNPKGKTASALTGAGAKEIKPDMYTEKELAFARHPDVVKNAYRAAVQSGYTDSYAKKSAYALREKLWPLIRQVQEKRARKKGVSASRIQHELACMGFANILDYVVIDDVKGITRPKGLHELTREEAAAIQEYELEHLEDEHTGEMVAVLKRIKLIDKRTALIDLGKTLGMFNEKMQLIMRGHEAKNRVVPLEDIATTDLEEIERILVAATGVVSNKKRDRNAITGRVIGKDLEE